MKNMKPHLHFDLNRWKGNVKVNTHACGSAEDLISMLSLGTVAVLRQTGISFDTYLEILVDANQLTPVSKVVTDLSAALPENKAFLEK